MSFNYKFLKWLLILLLVIFLSPTYLIAGNNLNIKVLNQSDEKIYRKVFKLQSKQIKSKNSIIWKKLKN